MNKIYKIVWSEIRHTYVAVSEIAKGHGRKSEKRSRLTALTLAAVMTLTGLGGMDAFAAASEHYSVNNDTSHDLTLEEDFNANGQGAAGIGSIAAGFKTGANGITSSVVGAYSYIGDVDHLGQPVSTNDPHIFQGATSAVFGSFNVVKTNPTVTKANQADGVANSVVGQANLTENSNGTIIMGAGNKVTNSYRDLNTDVNQLMLINAHITGYQEVLGEAVAGSGGQVMAIGGGNSVDKAYQSQVMGVGNTLTGVDGEYSEDGSTRLNYIEGFYNKAEKVQNAYIIGANNEVKNGNNNIVFGDNHKIDSNSNNVVIGSSDNLQTVDASDSVQVGHNAQAKGVRSVAVGYKAIVDGTQNTAVGFNVQAKGIDATAVGSSNNAYTNNSVAIGKSANAGTEGSTEGTDGNAKTYAVNVTTNGQVASGNTGIVTGGTVYDAIQNYDATNGMHYVSINSSVTSAGSNYANDGATGQRAIAIGESATATAKDAVAIGYKAKAEGEGAFAFGKDAVSQGKGTVAFTSNKAYGEHSMAWGFNNVAGISTDGTKTYVGATAFGAGTEARNDGATAMGNWSIAEGPDSVAMGNESHTHADARASLAMGQETHTLGTGSFAGGTESIAGGFNSFAHGYTAEAVGSTAIAMGTDAKAIGDESVALGYNSNAFGNYSVAILGGRTGNGTFSYDKDFEMYDVDVTDNAIGAIAAGFGSVAMKDYTVALGRHATVNNDKSMALGEDAVVSADNSVALGTEAVATEQNVISVGHKQGDAKYGGGTYDTALNRKIVNVASGVNDTDAVNVKQLTEAVGDKANKDLDNITDAGHSVIKSDAKSVINVVGADKATVTKADVNGVDTYTVSVKADGAVADGNENIVNGGTVYNALQAQKNEMNTALDGKANIGLDNITDNGKTVVRSLAQEAVKVVNGTNTTVTEGADGNAKTYAVNVTTNGTVTSGDTGVVTGGTVYDAIQDIVTGDMTGKANISLDNVNDAGHAVIKTDAKSAINVVGNDDITVNKTDVSGVDTYNLSIVKNGTIASGNEGIVTGSTVFTETRPASDGNYIAVNKTAGENLTALDEAVKVNEDAIATNAGDITNLKNLSNITEAGETVVKNLAKGSVNVVGTNKATVTKSDVNGVDTYTVDVVANGTVTQGNENLVSGGTVYDALQAQKTETTTALEGKANVTLDNVNEAGHSVIKTDAKSAVNVVGGNYATVDKTDVNGVDTYTVNVATDGAVADGNTKLVTGGTVYEALTTETRPSADGNYISKTNTAGENLTALDTQVKTNADNIVTNTSDITNLKDLSNITEAGESVIKELSKGSVNVVGTNKATVTKSNVNGVDTYMVDVTANGTVTSGDNNIVTGGTVYNALQTQKDEINTAIGELRTDLDGKLNTNMDNLTEDGRTAISDIAKESVKVEGSGLAKVTSAEQGNVKVYTVDVKADGKVASGDTGLVTGDTIYNETRPADGNYVKNGNTTAENLSAIDTQVKTNTDDISNINQTVNNMGGRINKLGTRINKVGAGAAALAALHPQDFDPDDKWDVAAGYGNYKDANAAAVGAFYHPNEDTMISVGGSFGGGENMVNAGVSVKLGQGNHVTTSRVAMAREILDMKQKMEKLEAQNEYLMNRLGAAPEGTLRDVNFPDVPKDHWAYQYVKTLADKGYITGYPDGTFKGDRAMTRYEYAAVIYRALQNGAPVDEKMAKVLDEFEPELDHIQKAARFRVDRISGKDEDRGKVERVRVNNDQEERDVYGGKIPAALKK